MLSAEGDSATCAAWTEAGPDRATRRLPNIHRAPPAYAASPSRHSLGGIRDGAEVKNVPELPRLGERAATPAAMVISGAVLYAPA